MLLKSTGLDAQKAILVSSFTKFRTESTKEMTFAEADDMIRYLQGEANKDDGSNQMRRKILSVCHNLNWKKADGKVDLDVLDQWCLNHSYLKKRLMEYTYKELPKLVTQVQSMYSSMLKKSSS